jgi:hypothetical protein
VDFSFSFIKLGMDGQVIAIINLNSFSLSLVVIS